MRRRSILITGGAGFIGTNLAESYLAEGHPVHVFDNLARPGVERNISELQDQYGDYVQFTQADVSDKHEIEKAVAGASAVYHLAAQVAVTTSLQDPMSDLRTNLLGTLHILEAIRRSAHRPTLLFTSTNKVYGKLGSIGLRELSSRYEPQNASLAAAGASEEQPLEFLSPYGCSKGAADQYVLDYARSYDLPAAVFRMSCIYGPHQLGSEDQGWVAHFLRQAMKGESITIYGDGKQVRDLLFVEDLVHAMRLTEQNMASVAGEAFNMGGGVENSTSLLDLIRQVESLTDRPVRIDWGEQRLGDQCWFVADSSKFRHRFGWRPEVNIREGLRRLHSWYVQRPAAVGRSVVQVA